MAALLPPFSTAAVQEWNRTPVGHLGGDAEAGVLGRAAEALAEAQALARERGLADGKDTHSPAGLGASVPGSGEGRDGKQCAEAGVWSSHGRAKGGKHSKAQKTVSQASCSRVLSS